MIEKRKPIPSLRTSCNKTSVDTKFIDFEPSENDSKINFEFRKSNLPNFPVADIISLNGPNEKDGTVVNVTLDRCNLICIVVHT